MKHCIVDIDGTLADASHRLHYICNPDLTRKYPSDWDGFFSYDEMMKDRPIYPVLDIIHGLNRDGYDLVFVTGRPERTRVATFDWFDLHRPYNVGARFDVLMRPNDERTDDHLLKAQMVKDYLTHKHDGTPTRSWIEDHVIAFEDRNRCVEAYRNMGITVFQPAKGDF
jgi:phosphoglycolate phosphatase-like HAD superfamily hydrolase